MTEIINRIAHYTTEFFKCYLCNKIFADGDEPWHMFEKRLSENGQNDCPLASILSSALGKDLDQKSVHSKLICDECNVVLLEYERIEKRFYQFRLKILTDYNNTAKENNLEPIWFEINEIDENSDNVQMIDMSLSQQQQQQQQQLEQQNVEQKNLIQNVNTTQLLSLGVGGINVKLENDEIITHIPILAGQEVSHLAVAKKDKSIDEEEEIEDAEMQTYKQELIEHDDDEEDFVDEELDATQTILIENSQTEQDDIDNAPRSLIAYEEKGIHVITEEISYEQIIEQSSVTSYENSIIDVQDEAIDYNSSNDENRSTIIPDAVPIRRPRPQHRKNTTQQRLTKREHSNTTVDNQQEQQQQQQQQILGLEFEFNGIMYICPLCPEPSEHEPMLFANHLKTVHSYKYYVCDICYKGFHKRNEVSDHMDEFHGNGTETGEFHCENCMRVFLNLRQFRIHKRLHYSSSKQHECSECHKKYSSKNLLDEHMNMHTGQRPYKCPSCDKDFASKYTLQAHMKIHTKRPRPYSCDECDKSFLNQQNLVQHKKLHTGVKAFICEVCQKAFGTQHNLDVHKIVHSGNKPFICRTCGKGFARRAEINDHERTHTGERPFKCDICTMAFAQRSNLTTHKKVTHFNDRKHKCTKCERSFKRRRLLEYHVQSAHTGERPHKCDVCSATFVYPEHFKKHMRIHTGVKPFACEVCGKLFNSRDNRNAHRFIHSEKKPYECMECGMGFMRKPLLLAHMKHTKHVNDTIIVNQPQISHKGVLEVYKETTDEEQEQDQEIDDETLLVEHQEHKQIKIEDNNEMVDQEGFDEIVTSDTILVEDGDGHYIKDEDGEVKYLQFAEMDKDGQETFTWVDIGGSKTDDN